MLIKGMLGMGDNIYQRAFVREIKERVYLYTSWPQLYFDLPNIKCVEPLTNLRTQHKNIKRQPRIAWEKAPCLPIKQIIYGAATLSAGSILDAMRNCFGVNAMVFDIPKFRGPYIKKPYAVIRPATIRSEWKNTARNSDPKYISDAANHLMRSGYTVVSVADLQDGEEWTDELPPCNVDFNCGELIFEELMGLIQGASVVVGGVGWIVPASISSGIPLITILGGHGGHNAPEKITGSPMNLEKTRWIYPDNFCRCTNMLHQCNKTISNFDDKFKETMNQLCLIN
ncbi:MAG: hypothetical protein WC998_06075 [Candidatus Paceibacterota bacterium]|jgi:hypothetical protein